MTLLAPQTASGASDAHPALPAGRTALNQRYAIHRIDGPAAVVAAAQDVERSAAGGVFQSPLWLQALFTHLAPASDTTCLALDVIDAATRERVLFLPLIAQREGGLRVVRLPSCGVSDYGGAWLGPAVPTEPADITALWRALRAALGGFDLIELENMPLTIGGRSNPLARVGGAHPARHSRHALHLPGTVEDMLRGLGKKYRKEAERCGRLWAERGATWFRRPEPGDGLDAAYATLEAQQAARRNEAGGGYVLDRPQYSQFYAEVLRGGVPAGTAHLFTLGAGDETGACLLGLSDGDTFTLLRISTAGGDWKRLSPGRLVILETMRHFLARGVRTFDMGIGDYPFKDGFGIVPEPLVSVSAPLRAKAWPRFAMAQVREQARRSPRLRQLVHRMRRT